MNAAGTIRNCGTKGRLEGFLDAASCDTYASAGFRPLIQGFYAAPHQKSGQPCLSLIISGWKGQLPLPTPTPGDSGPRGPSVPAGYGSTERSSTYYYLLGSHRRAKDRRSLSYRWPPAPSRVPSRCRTPDATNIEWGHCRQVISETTPSLPSGSGGPRSGTSTSMTRPARSL